MGRSISFVEFDPVLGEESEESFTGVSLGSGDAFPCYWRLLMIAGYRRVLANVIVGFDDAVIDCQSMIDEVELMKTEYGSVDDSSCGFHDDDTSSISVGI